MNELSLPHGNVRLPAFFPDGTRGVVKGLDAADLVTCGVEGLVMNAYHLMNHPGPGEIKAMGGLNQFIGWDRPILTDSGGFQVFSLIRENAAFGEIRDDGLMFRPEGKASGKKITLTPEKCVRSQFSYGSDIIMCLDWCTHPGDPYEVNKRSVEMTVNWAKKCRDEYGRVLASSPKLADNPPRLFGIIQGGGDKALRRECAGALIDIGFDGFGFGGWPLDEDGALMLEILEYTASLMPGDKPKYAMGLGRPEGVAACHRMGYNLFDCVIPTREARHNRLYVFNEGYGSARDIDVSAKDFYGYFYAADDKYRRDKRPVSAICDCPLCRYHSRAYLRHLYAIGDSLAHRLATMHNLRFYTMLLDVLRVTPV